MMGRKRRRLEDLIRYDEWMRQDQWFILRLRTRARHGRRLSVRPRNGVFEILTQRILRITDIQ